MSGVGLLRRVVYDSFQECRGGLRDSPGKR